VGVPSIVVEVVNLSDRPESIDLIDTQCYINNYFDILKVSWQDPRRPGERFFALAIYRSEQGRWFAVGRLFQSFEAAADSAWYGRQEYRESANNDYLEITPMQALRALRSTGMTIPPDLAALVGTGGPQRGGRQSADAEPLDKKHTDILKALLKLNALGPDHRKKQSDIAVTAWGKGADPDECKRPCAKLRNLGLIGTKEGPQGGSWLTPEGRKRAESE
jgi:hypothetical protein